MNRKPARTARLSSDIPSTNSGRFPRTAASRPAASRAEVTPASAKRITGYAEVLRHCPRRAEYPPAAEWQLPARAPDERGILNDARPERHPEARVRRCRAPGAPSDRAALHVQREAARA